MSSTGVPARSAASIGSGTRPAPPAGTGDGGSVRSRGSLGVNGKDAKPSVVSGGASVAGSVQGGASVASGGGASLASGTSSTARMEHNGFVCPEEFKDKFTPLEFEQVVNMFCEFDANGNGTIDYYEAQKIAYALGAADSAEKASRLMKLIDLDGSGEVEFPEFCRFFILLKKGDGAFAEFKGFLDLVYETPLGMLEYQAQLRHLKTRYHLVEERAATESEPPSFKVELLISGVWHEIVDGLPVSKSETKRFQGAGKSSKEAKLHAAIAAVRKLHSFMPGTNYEEGTFPDEWIQWVDTNLSRGVSASKVLDVLIRKGFHPHRNLAIMQKISVSLSFDKFITQYPDFDFTGTREINLHFKEWVLSQANKGIDGNIIVRLLEERNVFIKDRHPHLAQQLMNNEIGAASNVNGQDPKILDFWQACADGHVDDIRLYVMCPIAVDEEKMGPLNSISRTGLALAAINNQTEIMELLIKRGADVNHLDRRNRTPLHLAAANGCSEACAILINHGCHIFARDHGGNTALHLAAAKNHPVTVDMLSLLCQSVTRSITSDKKPVKRGVTFLELAEECFSELQEKKLNTSDPRRFEKGWLCECANLFISKMDEDTKYLLGPCSDEIMNDVLRRFDLRPDAGIMAREATKDKSFYAKKRDTEVKFIPIIGSTRELSDLLRYCFRQSALDNCNEWRRTALHMACDMNVVDSHAEVVAILADKYGSNLYLKDRHGKTPFDLLVLDRPMVRGQPTATAIRENLLFDAREGIIEDYIEKCDDEDLAIVTTKRDNFLNICISKAEFLSNRLWVVTKEASLLRNTFLDWEEYVDPDTLNLFYCKKPDEDSYTGLHTDFTWHVPKEIKQLMDKTNSWLIHRSMRAEILREIGGWVMMRCTKSNFEYYYNLRNDTYDFHTPKPFEFFRLRQKAELVQKLGFQDEWQVLQLSGKQTMYYNVISKLYSWDKPSDAVVVTNEMKYCSAFKDKGRRIDQRWYTCEECNQNWKALQDDPRAKIMIKICEPCSVRCHGTHKGLRFIRSSPIVCMCLSACKGFCNCKAQQVSNIQLHISEIAKREREEVRRKRIQAALMPPIFAMVPRYDASGVFKRESGWLICRRAPIRGIAELCLADDKSVKSYDSTSDEYSNSVLDGLMEVEPPLLEDREDIEDKLKELEDASQERENDSDWIEVYDAEDPVQLSVGTVVLCAREGQVRKAYGVIDSISKNGISIIKFRNGETEPIPRHRLEVLSKPIFMFNPTTGQSYWKKAEIYTTSMIFGEKNGTQSIQIQDGNNMPNSLEEPSEITGGFIESQSLMSLPEAPARIFESDSLGMDFEDWENFRIISNVRRHFKDYTEYEDPVLRIIFLSSDSLIQREIAAMTIQRIFRSKRGKPIPIAWTTLAFSFETPEEVYKEQKTLAGWAMLRRQSKMIGYFTDIGRMEWEEYMDPESSNFFYWAEEKNYYQWERPEVLGRSQMSNKKAPALSLNEEVRYKFPGEEKEELCVVTRCRFDDQTGLDCYDLMSKRNDDLTARWIPRYLIKKSVILGEDIRLIQEEKGWRKTLKMQREKEIRNRHRIKAKKIAEEQERRKQFFKSQQYDEDADGTDQAKKDADAPKPPGPSKDEEMDKGLKQFFQVEALAQGRSKRCKQEEQEIQDEKDKEYLAKRKVGVVSMMNELAKDLSLTRIELINLQRALTLKLTLYDKLKTREQVLQSLIARRELVKTRRETLEAMLRDIDSKMSTPRSLMRRKILRRVHICMNRQLSGYITCEWGCNDWVRVGQEQMDHQIRGCTKRIVECTLHCSLRLSEDEWLAPHQNLENIDHELAAEFARYEPVRPPVVPYQQFHEENECPKRLKPCPRKCLEWATFEELDKHLELFCVKRPAHPIICRLGCGKTFGGVVEQLIEAEDQRLEHEQEECEYRIVRCIWKNSDGSYCAAQIRCCDREIHRAVHVEQMGIHTYAIAGTYLYKVPPRIHRLKMQVWGAGGGSGHFKYRNGGAGGGGAFVEVIMHVNPHDVLEVVVGAPGQAGVYGTEVEVIETTDYSESDKVEAADRKFEVIEAKYGTALGGTPGGGEGYGGGGNWAAGGGGGYSMVARRTTAGSVPLVVAGGGGGGSSLHGIPGGGMTGPLPGTLIDIRNGHLATAEAGGEAGDSGSAHNSLWPATSGEAWKAGNGSQFGGGGGGGYYGGGGGGTVPGIGGGGGGGSSYVQTDIAIDHVIIHGSAPDPGGMQHNPPDAVGLGDWDKVGGPAGRGGIGDIYELHPGNAGAVRILKPGFFHE